MNTSYLFLEIAILSETIATTAMKSSAGFTRLFPTLLTVAGYICAFYFMSKTLTFIPTGVAYALWAGIGIVLISIFG